VTLRLMRSNRDSSALRRRPAVMTKNIAIGSAGIIAGVDSVGTPARGAAVEQVEGLALGEVVIGVQELDLGDEGRRIAGRRPSQNRPAARRR